MCGLRGFLRSRTQSLTDSSCSKKTVSGKGTPGSHLFDDTYRRDLQRLLQEKTSGSSEIIGAGLNFKQSSQPASVLASSAGSVENPAAGGRSLYEVTRSRGMS